MRNLILLFTLISLFLPPAYGTTFTGGVTKVGQQESNQVIDARTKQGIEFAKITIPQKNFQT